jgi:hypothetical protein
MVRKNSLGNCLDRLFSVMPDSRRASETGFSEDRPNPRVTQMPCKEPLHRYLNTFFWSAKCQIPSTETSGQKMAARCDLSRLLARPPSSAQVKRPSRFH